jgi:hypothetical protein
MTDNRSEVWQEIKSGCADFFKIFIYTIVGVGFCFGVGYVYLYCCQ